MTDYRYSSSSSDSATLGRIALLAVVAVGGALAVAGLFDYLARERGERIGVGTGPSPLASAEEWLRHTAARLQQGSHDLLASVDRSHSDLRG